MISSQQQQLGLGHQIMMQQQNLLRQQQHTLSSSQSSAALGGASLTGMAGGGLVPPFLNFPSTGLPNMMDTTNTSGAMFFLHPSSSSSLVV